MADASWEQVYKLLEPAQLPWNAGGPDADLRRLVQAGAIPPGPAFDIGTGPGHDAVFLAQNGFRVSAVDVSALAIALAKTTAESAGVSSVDFQAADVLALRPAPGSQAFVFDRGCFHFFSAENRAAYQALVASALKPGGLLFVKTFSDKEPPGVGPKRFTLQELTDCFSGAFSVVEAGDSVFEGPAKAKAVYGLFRKT